jgi:hypothetical protein
MIRRRPKPAPELPLDRQKVLEIMEALSDFKAWTFEILSILSEEQDDER